MQNKKAVSPLIATVLLIAFAVSLGAVLLTYLTSFGECSGTEIEIPTVSGEPQVCYNTQTNKLEFTVENTGSESIEYLKLALTGALSVENIEVDRTIPRSDTEKISIDYKLQALGKIQKLKITPVVIEDNEEIVCPNQKAITVEGIPDCV